MNIEAKKSEIEAKRLEVIASGDVEGNFLFALQHGDPNGEHREVVIKNGGGGFNYHFARNFGEPELHRQAVIKSGDGYANYNFACRFDDPTGEHRQSVIDSGDGYANYKFAEKFGDPTGEHRQVVIKNGDGYDNYNFACDLGEPELHRQAVMDSKYISAISQFIKRFGEAV